MLAKIHPSVRNARFGRPASAGLASVIAALAKRRLNVAVAFLRIGLPVALALASLAPASPALAGGNVWTSNGPGGGNIGALAIDPETPTTLYAGTFAGGVYKSVDGGGSWNPTNNGLMLPHGYVDVRALAIDPATPDTLFAGTIEGGVFKSTNGGANWSPANTGLTTTVVFALAIVPATPSTMYAGTVDGVFKSANGGANWSRASIGLTGTVNALAIDPATSATLYAGVSDYAGAAFGRVFKSTNGGGNWSKVDTGLPGTSVRAVVIDPLTHATVYAGSFYSGGVSKSTNGGGNWSPTGLTAAEVNALAIDPTAPATLYAGTNGGIFKSTDGGGSWRPLVSGLTPADAFALAIDPTTPATVYAGADSGVFSIQRVLTLSPAIGLTTGGTTVTIHGLDFAPATGVTVTIGNAAATNTTIVDAATITATTGAHAPGPVDVVVTNPDHHSVTVPNGFVYADTIYQAYLPVTGR